MATSCCIRDLLVETMCVSEMVESKQFVIMNL